VSPASNTKGPGPSAGEVQKNRAGGNGNNNDNGNDNAATPSPVVLPPAKGNRDSGLLAQELEASKSRNTVGQACTPRTMVCLGTDNYGFCDNGKIVLGGTCARLELSCFNVPLLERVGTTVTCMSKTEFDQRLEAALDSDAGNNASGSIPIASPVQRSPSPAPAKSPSPANSPVSTGNFKKDNGVLAQQLEATKDQNVAGQPCENGSKPICLGGSGVGLCGNGKILATAPCAGGLQCFNAPLVNKPGTEPTCMSEEEFARRLATALAS